MRLLHFFQFISAVSVLLVTHTGCESPRSCENSGDCPNARCSTESGRGVCLPRCSDDSDCATNEVCRLSCLPEGTAALGESCDSSMIGGAECRHGLSCGVYEPASPTEGTCQPSCMTERGFSDELCPEGQLCAANGGWYACVQPCALEGPTACGDGFLCFDGECYAEESIRLCSPEGLTCALGEVCLHSPARCVTEAEAFDLYPRPTTGEFYVR